MTVWPGGGTMMVCWAGGGTLTLTVCWAGGGKPTVELVLKATLVAVETEVLPPRKTVPVEAAMAGGEAGAGRSSRQSCRAGCCSRPPSA